MTSTAYLQSLKDRGLLDELYREGVIPPRWIIVLETRNKIDSMMRSGYSHGRAVREVASLMRVSVRSIYYYVSA